MWRRGVGSLKRRVGGEAMLRHKAHVAQAWYRGEHCLSACQSGCNHAERGHQGSRIRGGMKEWLEEELEEEEEEEEGDDVIQSDVPLNLFARIHHIGSKRNKSRKVLFEISEISCSR